MRIGIFADSHDHVDHVRLAVAAFNRADCDLVMFAGDFVSPIVVPPLRKLNCPVLACFGDNEGNTIGIEGGMRIVGQVGYPPFGFQAPDGTKILLTHAIESLKGLLDGADVVIYSHSHRAGISRDESGRLYINPGEASGWTYRKPSIAILETESLETSLVQFAEMPPVPVCE